MTFKLNKIKVLEYLTLRGYQKLFTRRNVIKFSLIIFIISSFTQKFIISVKAQPYTDISVQTGYDMINNKIIYPDLLILDVREQYEYDESHLYNSTLIPRLEIDGRISELLPYNGTEILVYCRTGVRSAMASQNLAENHNFTKIYNMLGGINAWISAGYPVETPADETNGQPTIGISSSFFLIILIGAVLFVTLYAKKHRSAK